MGGSSNLNLGVDMTWLAVVSMSGAVVSSSSHSLVWPVVAISAALPQDLGMRLGKAPAASKGILIRSVSTKVDSHRLEYVQEECWSSSQCPVPVQLSPQDCTIERAVHPKHMPA